MIKYESDRIVKIINIENYILIVVMDEGYLYEKSALIAISILSEDDNTYYIIIDRLFEKVSSLAKRFVILRLLACIMNEEFDVLNEKELKRKPEIICFKDNPTNIKELQADILASKELGTKNVIKALRNIKKLLKRNEVSEYSIIDIDSRIKYLKALKRAV